jgi:hypothetical protein
VDYRDDLLNLKQHSNLNFHTSQGEELTKQLQLRVTQLSTEEISISDHPA